MGDREYERALYVGPAFLPQPGSLTAECSPSRQCLTAHATQRNSASSSRRCASYVPKVRLVLWPASRACPWPFGRSSPAPRTSYPAPRSLTARYPQPARVHPSPRLLAASGHTAARQAGMEADAARTAREVLCKLSSACLSDPQHLVKTVMEELDAAPSVCGVYVDSPVRPLTDSRQNPPLPLTRFFSALHRTSNASSRT